MGGCVGEGRSLSIRPSIRLAKPVDREGGPSSPVIIRRSECWGILIETKRLHCRTVMMCFALHFPTSLTTPTKLRNTCGHVRRWAQTTDDRRARQAPPLRSTVLDGLRGWLLVVVCWLSVGGCWLLIVGCWLLDVGCRLLVVGCWLIVVGC